MFYLPHFITSVAASCVRRDTSAAVVSAWRHAGLGRASGMLCVCVCVRACARFFNELETPSYYVTSDQE